MTTLFLSALTLNVVSQSTILWSLPTYIFNILCRVLRSLFRFFCWSIKTPQRPPVVLYFSKKMYSWFSSYLSTKISNTSTTIIIIYTFLRRIHQRSQRKANIVHNQRNLRKNNRKKCNSYRKHWSQTRLALLVLKLRGMKVEGRVARGTNDARPVCWCKSPPEVITRYLLSLHHLFHSD